MATVLVSYPKGCPPDHAEAMDGTFYVYAERNLAIGDATGRMTWQRPYEKRRGDYYEQTDVAEAHGLSVFGDLTDVQAAREITPWLRKKSVAEVTVTSTSGWLFNSPTPEGDSHHDWWTDPYDLIPDGRVIEASTE